MVAHGGGVVEKGREKVASRKGAKPFNGQRPSRVLLTGGNEMPPTKWGKTI